MGGYLTTMVTRAAANSWSDGQLITLDEQLLTLTLLLVGRTLFNTDVHAGSAARRES